MLIPPATGAEQQQILSDMDYDSPKTAAVCFTVGWHRPSANSLDNDH